MRRRGARLPRITNLFWVRDGRPRGRRCPTWVGFDGRQFGCLAQSFDRRRGCRRALGSAASMLGAVAAHGRDALAKRDRNRRACKAGVAKQVVETRVRETVAFFEFTRAVLRKVHVGKSILDASDRDRFNAFQAPPSTEVPPVAAEWARGWDGGRITEVVSGGFRVDHQPRDCR